MTAPTLDLNCPRCGATDARSLAMVHASGSSRAVFVGDAVAVGTGTTALAQSAAPPKRRSALPAVVGGVGVGLAAMAFFALADPFPAAGALPAIEMGSIALGAITYTLVQRPRKRWNDEQFPALHAAWQATFQCMRCGATFRPK
jgi:hypothetical protein